MNETPFISPHLSKPLFYYTLNDRIPLMSSCFVIQLDLKLAPQLKDGLEAQGFTLSTPVHTLFQGRKKGITCTLYTSGKLTVQGSQMKEFVEYYLEPEILGSFTHGYDLLNIDLTPHMGVDESGKGDFFGPLCIAGVYCDEKGIERLVALGVKDSKKLSDTSILKLAAKIRQEMLHHVVKISPLKYNELYGKFGNLNKMLGWGHATVIDYLSDKSGCARAVIDQFAAEHVVVTALSKKKKTILLEQRTKAEADPVVAAASILARAGFVEGLKELEEKMGFPLPKGVSKGTKEAAKKVVHTFGKEALHHVAKVHFKTYLEIIEGLT